MSIPIPLTVRLSTNRGARHVEHEIRGLTMRWTDPGGYASCRISLDRPLHLQPDEIGYYGRLTVYDARNGAVVWDGRLEDPGRSAGSDGTVWELAALGGQAHTQDQTVPLIYVDRSYANFYRAYGNVPDAQAGVGQIPAGTAERTGVVLQFPEGATVTGNDHVNMAYSDIYRAGQKVAHVSISIDSGRNASSYITYALARTGPPYSGSPASEKDEFIDSIGMSTSAQSYVDYVGTSGAISDGRDVVQFQLEYEGSGDTVPKNTWAAYYNFRVKAMRYLADGTEITNYAGEPATVTASDVINDLLGRLLADYDGANAVIETDANDYGIGQLAYPDGVTAYKVLNDLMMFDTRYTWRVWDRRRITTVSGSTTSITEDFEDTTYQFTISGDPNGNNWFRSTTSVRSHGGSYAYKSAAISHSQSSRTYFTVPAGATTLQFWYRVSTEATWDIFYLLFDGAVADSDSGSKSWTQSPAYDVTGVTTVQFQYIRDSSLGGGSNAVWIDDVSFEVPDASYSQVTTNKYRFEWVQLPTTVRYEVDVIDGYESQGSSDGLYNQVTVRYQDDNDIQRTITRTAPCPDLDAAGLTRTGQLDLGMELGCGAQEDAERVGDQWLAEHTYAPNAGRLRVARPIRDLETGRMVMPWEIRPGLIRVRNVLPRPDVLNASARDGVTIFRIIGCDYSASDGAATLELDSRPNSLSQMLARLELESQLGTGSGGSTGRRRRRRHR